MSDAEIKRVDAATTPRMLVACTDRADGMRLIKSGDVPDSLWPPRLAYAATFAIASDDGATGDEFDAVIVTRGAAALAGVHATAASRVAAGGWIWIDGSGL